MLHHAKDLCGYSIHCRDGDIGTVKEFSFDDVHWTVRYLVVNTGTWLFGRQVLLSPQGIRAVHPSDKHIVVDLTKQQIEASPPLESDQPVSRQYEESFLGYYGWSTYWGTTGSLGMSPYFGIPPGIGGHTLSGSTESTYLDPNHGKPEQDDTVDPTMIQQPAGDPHLRSSKEVTGYDLIADDGDIGRVDDFIIDDTTWQIRYLIVATGHWWAGKQVLISPRWVTDIRWSDAKVFVPMARSVIRESPAYTDLASLTSEYQAQLDQHYQQS